MRDEIRAAEDGDDHLQERWDAGERSAAEELFNRYYALLVAYFRRKAVGATDDLVQQTMLAALEGYARLEGDMVFRAYLFGTARFQFVSYLRRLTKERPLDVASAGNEVCHLDVDQDERMEEDADQDEDEASELIVLRSEVARLPDELRTVLELVYWQELDPKEVAATLNVPLATVYSRLRRARGRLRTCVERMRSRALGRRQE